LHMDGTPSPQSRKIARFARQVRAALGRPIVFWDERLTSVEAEEHLEFLGVKWRKRREQVDKIAAMIILQNYLDSRPRATS
jgi:putative pre-16S rRNA nuclease